MEILSNIYKNKYEDEAVVVYYVEGISEALKGKIRSSLVSICHGATNEGSKSRMYSYKHTVQEFIKRYNKGSGGYNKRQKGMIGELLVHIILDIDNKFTKISPFFNLEERSAKKGFDVMLFEDDTEEVWITEVKSGEKRANQKNSSEAVVNLVQIAKNDLKKRLNDNESTSLWYNAINSAKVAMKNEHSQKDAVIKILEEYGDYSEDGNYSTKINVILTGVLFHPLVDRFIPEEVIDKRSTIYQENIFRKVHVIAIQKNTYQKVYEFLESEVKNEA